MLDGMYEGKMVSETMKLEYPIDDIWRLLCPVSEHDWIPGWECRIVHTESGTNELGCVFQTDFPLDGPTDTWVTSVFEPPSRLEFIRTNSMRVIRYSIELEVIDGATQLQWSQRIIPLCLEGVELAEAKIDSFASQIAGLKQMMNHYLDTGTMLNLIKE